MSGRSHNRTSIRRPLEDDIPQWAAVRSLELRDADGCARGGAAIGESPTRKWGHDSVQWANGDVMIPGVHWHSIKVVTGHNHDGP
jgi:hypothetical protein